MSISRVSFLGKAPCKASISRVTFLGKAPRKASIMSISRVTFLGKAPRKASSMSISRMSFVEGRGHGQHHEHQPGIVFGGRTRTRPAS